MKKVATNSKSVSVPPQINEQISLLCSFSFVMEHLVRGFELHLPEALPQKLQALRVPLILQRHWAENNIV